MDEVSDYIVKFTDAVAMDNFRKLVAVDSRLSHVHIVFSRHVSSATFEASESSVDIMRSLAVGAEFIPNYSHDLFAVKK